MAHIGGSDNNSQHNHTRGKKKVMDTGKAKEKNFSYDNENC